jgi:hypothetical protein
MATMVDATTRPTRGMHPRRPHLLVAAAIVLAVLGAVLATRTVIGARNTPAGIGDPVDTGFGTFTVTRLSKTFVPDTQGPPSAAQHAGSKGSDQVQVWVRLQNTAAGSKGAALSLGQFALVSEKGGQKPLPATGSSLDKSVLGPGGSIDGQVWFDPGPGSSGRRWLVFTPPGGDPVRVSLGSPVLSRTPSHGEGKDPGH